MTAECVQSPKFAEGPNTNQSHQLKMDSSEGHLPY